MLPPLRISRDGGARLRLCVCGPVRTDGRRGDGFPDEAIRGEGKWGAVAWRTSLRVRPWRGKVQTASAAEREC